MTRSFPLPVVLSVMTGRPVAPATAEGALHLMEWMTAVPLIIRDRILFRRIPAVSRASASALRVHHSDLAAVLVPDFTDAGAVAEWASAMTARFGPTRDIARLYTVPRQRTAA